MMYIVLMSHKNVPKENLQMQAGTKMHFLKRHNMLSSAIKLSNTFATPYEDNLQ